MASIPECVVYDDSKLHHVIVQEADGDEFFHWFCIDCDTMQEIPCDLMSDFRTSLEQSQLSQVVLWLVRHE